MNFERTLFDQTTYPESAPKTFVSYSRKYPSFLTDRDKQRQTETDRDRQRQTETDRDRQTQTETYRDKDRTKDNDRERAREREYKVVLGNSRLE